MTTIEATRELRKHLGVSQQAFANRLGLSIRAVANYESDRTPTGRVLVALSRAAFEQGRMDLHQVFAEAVVAEIQVARDSLHYGFRRHDNGAKSAYLLMDVEGADAQRRLPPSPRP